MKPDDTPETAQRPRRRSPARGARQNVRPRQIQLEAVTAPAGPPGVARSRSVVAAFLAVVAACAVLLAGAFAYNGGKPALLDVPNLHETIDVAWQPG